MGHLSKLLRSCDIYWGQALERTHMLLGFKTVTYAKPELPDTFFKYAIDYDLPVYDAWRQATKDVFGSDVEAVAIVDSLEQKENDHLHGQGYVAPDDPDVDSVYYFYWSC